MDWLLGSMRRKRTRRRKRKSRKKRRTRRAGTLKQSNKPGKRGLTYREIVARDIKEGRDTEAEKLKMEKLADARLKKSNPYAWKKKRLNKLKTFNKKMENITKFGSTKKNLNLDMHKASGEFEKLRLFPVNSGPGESYNDFTKRMASPITISSKTSTGGKKTRKKRKRKKRRK